MSTYDARLATLEKDVAVMQQDIIYKLDENNSEIATLKRITLDHGLKIKDLADHVEALDFRLNGVEIGLESLKQEVEAMEEKFDKRLISMEEKFDKRLISMEEKSNKQFSQVLQMLATLMNKAV